MHRNVSLAYSFLLLIASASAISSAISVFTLNGKSYLNGEYEVVTKDNAIRITNGKLEDVLQMRKLTEDEQQTIKMAKQNMDKQMADTMNEQLRVQQEIQQQINDDMQEIYSGFYDSNIFMGYNGFYNDRFDDYNGFN